LFVVFILFLLSSSFYLFILALVLTSRESNTPAFPYTSSRVPSLAKLVAAVFSTCQCSAKEIASMLPRANVIVREYRPGQQIAFHVDELECDSEVRTNGESKIFFFFLFFSFIYFIFSLFFLFLSLTSRFLAAFCAMIIPATTACYCGRAKETKHSTTR
jgi:hypothetical protein